MPIRHGVSYHKHIWTGALWIDFLRGVRRITDVEKESPDIEVMCKFPVYSSSSFSSSSPAA